MTAAEILQSVQFIVNHEGKPTAAVLHIEAWEAIVSLLEDLEDTELVKERLRNWSTP